MPAREGGASFADLGWRRRGEPPGRRGRRGGTNDRVAAASGEAPALAAGGCKERRRGGAAKGLGELWPEARGAAPALRKRRAAAEVSEAADGVPAAWRGAAHAQEGGAAE
jgi:hypothetical protein